MVIPSDSPALEEYFTDGPGRVTARFEKLAGLIGWFAEYLTLPPGDFDEKVRSFACVRYGRTGVVALSAYDTEPENLARIRLAERWRSSLEALMKESVPLLLNGAAEQLEMLMDLAGREGVAEDRLVRVDCGERDVASTTTQFDALRRLGYESLVAVTTQYHVPRVLLTAQRRLTGALCHVAGVPYADFPYDASKVVFGEIWRILQYAAKGDIADPLELLSPTCTSTIGPEHF